MKNFVEKLLEIANEYGGEIHIKATKMYEGSPVLSEMDEGSPVLSAAWKSGTDPFGDVFGDFVLMDNGSAEDVVEAVRSIAAEICRARI